MRAKYQQASRNDVHMYKICYNFDFLNQIVFSTNYFATSFRANKSSGS